MTQTTKEIIAQLGFQAALVKNIFDPCAELMKKAAERLTELDAENTEFERLLKLYMQEAIDYRPVLMDCAKVFRIYEKLHLAKPDKDKAERNERMAIKCEQALAKHNKGETE